MPERDVEFQLTARDKTGPAVKGAADGFEHLGDKADKAKRKIDDLGDETGHLSRKMLEARAAALRLANEFDKVGDSKILKEFEKVNREAAKLGRVAKTIKFAKPETPDGLFGNLVTLARKAGLIAGDAAVDGIGDVLKASTGSGGVILAGLTAVVAAAAPVLAGAAEGAVLAGVASGGLAAGLILAAKDPQVTAEYSALAGRIGPKLQAAAHPLALDLLAAAPKFEAAFAQQEPRIHRIFARLAGNFAPIIDNIISAVHKIAPSIERAMAVGGRILESLSAQIAPLAGDIGDLLDAFSAGGPGAAAAIGLIILQLRGMIELLAFGARASAPFLNFFGKLAEASHLVPDESGWTHHLDTIDKTGTAAGAAATNYHILAQSMGNTANQAKALNDAFDRLFNEQMNVDQANLQVNIGLSQLTETIKGNKRTLDEHTAAGQQNVGVIQQQIQNLNRKREADIAAGNGTVEATQKANAAYNAQLEGLRKLLYSLGLNHTEVDKLIDAYEQLAKPQVKNFTTVFKQVGAVPPGASDQSTGHSRTGTNDYSGLSGWAPARFAAAAREGFAGGSTTGPRTPPVEVHSESHFTVTLDGQPFEARIVRAVSAAEQRQAWRAKVGRR